MLRRERDIEGMMLGPKVTPAKAVLGKGEVCGGGVENKSSSSPMGRPMGL